MALRPLRIQLDAQQVFVEVELLLGNLQPSAAENIKVDLAMISASPDQDQILAGYHASPLLEAATQPFDLPSGAGQQLAATLVLPRDRIHVVDVGGRPMFVPLVMVDVRWRAGISLRRFAADFMVGTAGQGDKLGPIWLDRSVSGPLAATRYRPRI